MKRILCFGDSNTWGCIPIKNMVIERFDKDIRWPGILQNQLGEEFEIVEDGCCGRTTAWDDQIEGDRNGQSHLPHILHSHQPLDLIIIMLGTNDLKSQFNKSAYDIASAVNTLIDIIRKKDYFSGQTPEILLVAPPPIRNSLPEPFDDMLRGGYEKSVEFSTRYKAVAMERECAFFDAGEIITSSPIDGIHWAAEEHKKMGKSIAAVVRKTID